MNKMICLEWSNMPFFGTPSQMQMIHMMYTKQRGAIYVSHLSSFDEVVVQVLIAPWTVTPVWHT